MIQNSLIIYGYPLVLIYLTLNSLPCILLYYYQYYHTYTMTVSCSINSKFKKFKLVNFLIQADHPFADLITNFNIMQLITSPTHDRSNILHLIISHTSISFSNHFVLQYNLSYHKPCRPYMLYPV